MTEILINGNGYEPDIDAIVDIGQCVLYLENLKNDPEHAKQLPPNYKSQLENKLMELKNNRDLLDNTPFNTPVEGRDLASKRDNFGTTSGQLWGKYTQQFLEIAKEAGRIDYRLVAEAMGLKPSDSTVRKIIHRHRGKEFRQNGKNPYMIDWIYRDWKATNLDGGESQKLLDIKIPLDIDELASLPERAIVGVAGFTSAGKTAFLLDMADLNAKYQDKRIYYWYNEMSESKLRTRLEDFPYLITAYKEKRFFAVPQEGFDEFGDVIQPDAINLIDYLDKDENFFTIGDDIKKIYRPLGSGIAVFAQQMAHGAPVGVGGWQSVKLSNLYITLDTEKQEVDKQRCVAKIVKCKDWASETCNPVNMRCKYYTGGKHGILIKDGEWERK